MSDPAPTPPRNILYDECGSLIEINRALANENRHLRDEIERKDEALKNAVKMLKQFDGTGAITDLLWFVSTEENSDE